MTKPASGFLKPVFRRTEERLREEADFDRRKLHFQEQTTIRGNNYAATKTFSDGVTSTLEVPSADPVLCHRRKDSERGKILKVPEAAIFYLQRLSTSMKNLVFYYIHRSIINTATRPHAACRGPIGVANHRGLTPTCHASGDVLESGDGDFVLCMIRRRLCQCHGMELGSRQGDQRDFPRSYRETEGQTH